MRDLECNLGFFCWAVYWWEEEDLYKHRQRVQWGYTQHLENQSMERRVQLGLALFTFQKSFYHQQYESIEGNFYKHQNFMAHKNKNCMHEDWYYSWWQKRTIFLSTSFNYSSAIEKLTKLICWQNLTWMDHLCSLSQLK